MRPMFRGIVFSYFLSQLIQIELVHGAPTSDRVSEVQNPEIQSQQLLIPQANAPQANSLQINASQANAPQANAPQAIASQINASQTSASQTSAPNSSIEIDISSENLENTFKHLIRRVEKNGQISGFHIYGSSAKVIELSGSFNLVKISNIESILIPKTMDQKEFHGGYLIKNRKNFGWKTFFPVDWDRENIGQYLIDSNKNHLNIRKPINREAGLFRYELAPVQGRYPVPSVLIYDNNRKVIKTLYPKINPVSIQDSELLAALDPQSSRKAAADAPSSSVRPEKLDPQLSEKLNLILEDYDIDGLQELKEKEPGQTSKVLKSLLSEAISSFDKDAVEKLIWWCEVEIDQTHIFRILKKINPPIPAIIEGKSDPKTKLGAAELERARAAEKARADEAHSHAHSYAHSRVQATQVLIAQILLQAFKGLNESLIDEVLNSGNQALVQAVLAECVESKNDKLIRYVRDRKMSKIKKLYRGLTGFLYVMFEKPNKTNQENTNQKNKDTSLESSVGVITAPTQVNREEEKSQPSISSGSFPSSVSAVKNNSLSDEEKIKIKHAMLDWDGTKEKNPSNEILDLFFRLPAEESKKILLPLLFRLKKDKPYISRYLLKRKKTESLAMLKSWSQMGDDFQACKTWFILNPGSLEDWLIHYRNEISDKNLFEILSKSGTTSLLQSIHHHLSLNSKSFPESYRFVNEQILKEKASVLVPLSRSSVRTSATQPTQSEDVLEDSELTLHKKLKSALQWGKAGFSNSANDKTLIHQIKCLLHTTSFDVKPAGSDSSCKDLAKKLLEEKRPFLSQSLKSHLMLVKNKEKRSGFARFSEHNKENTSGNLIHSNILGTDLEGRVCQGLEHDHSVQNKTDHERIFDCFSRSMKEGHRESQLPLGEMYYLGYGMPRNYQKALELFLPLAEEGNVKASFYLGEIYLFGKTGERNYEKAAYYFKIALKDEICESRAEIEFYLQLMNTDGRATKIIEFYTVLANENDIFAQFFLGEMYFYGLGVKRDYVQALYWLRKTSERSIAYPKYEREILAQVQYYIGEMFYYGLGDVSIDVQEAINWFSDSKENGNSSASVYLGRLAHFAYLDGTVNFQIANQYFDSAVKLDDPKAFYYTGVLYEYFYIRKHDELERNKKEFFERKNDSSDSDFQVKADKFYKESKQLKETLDWYLEKSKQLLVEAEKMGFDAQEDSPDLNKYDDRITPRTISKARWNFNFAISNPNSSIEEYAEKNDVETDPESNSEVEVEVEEEKE